MGTAGAAWAVGGELVEGRGMSPGSSYSGPHQSSGNSKSSVAELLGEVGDHDSSGGSWIGEDGAHCWAGISPWSMQYSNDGIDGGGGTGMGPAVGTLWSGVANPHVSGC